MKLSDQDRILLVKALDLLAMTPATWGESLLSREAQRRDIRVLNERLLEPAVTIYCCFNRDCPGPGPDGVVYFTTPECPRCSRPAVQQDRQARLSEVPRRRPGGVENHRKSPWE